jgi:hypothetical protein
MADWSPPEVKGSVDVSGWTPPEVTTKEPTGMEKAYAFGHGLVTGALGAPGAFESMITVPAPEGSPLRGHETVFLTPEEISGGFEKLGIPQPRAGTENWQLLGELAPAIYGGGKLLYKGGEYILTRGGEIVSRWRGKPLEAATGKLESELKSTTGKAEQDVERQAKEKTQQLTSEQVRRGVAQRSVAGQLEKGAEQAKAESVTALNKIAKPTDDYRLGASLREKITGREGELKTVVDAEATRLKNLYLSEGAKKEKAGQYWSQSQTGQEFLRYLKTVIDPKNSGKYAPGEVQASQELFNTLMGKKVGGQVIRSELTKIESVIRDTKKLPSLPTMTGAEAQKQQYMGKLAQKLEDSVYGYVDEAGAVKEGFAPTGRQFREVYREMMKPLNAYESPVGKVVTQQVEGLKGIFTSDATAVPGAVFRSPQQVQVLERMGVSKSTLEPYAAQYTANQLSKFNKAEDVARWLKSTEASYLQEFPSVAKKAEEYASTFAKNEATVAGKTEAAGKIRQFAQRGSADLKADVEKLKQMSAGDKKDIADGLYKVMNAKNPTNMAAQARTYVINLRNKGFIQDAEAAQLLDQVKQVETAVKDKEAATTALKGLLPYATAVGVGTSVLGYSLNKLLGGL